MNANTYKLIVNFFRPFEENYSFKFKNNANTEDLTSLEIEGTNFGIRIEKYRRDLQAILYDPMNESYEFDLYNTLEFIGVDSVNYKILKSSDEALNEDELNNFWSSNLERISYSILTNMSVLEDFFDGKNMDSKSKDMRNFVMNRNPNLFRRVGE